MYVCVCQGITDGQVRQAMSKEGCCSYRELRQTLGIGTQCGKCACVAKQLVRETLSARSAQSNGALQPIILASA